MSLIPGWSCSSLGLLLHPCSSLFLQGGVKVLITGPWQEASNNYSCLFDQISVPASLIQPGVLRCYCPGERAPPAEGMGSKSVGLTLASG